MNKIAIIIRHDDDSWEKDSSYETVIGYLVPWENVDLDTRAKSYIFSLQEYYKTLNKTYKNILGTIYPIFTYKIIGRSDSHILNFENLTTNSPTDSSKTI